MNTISRCPSTKFCYKQINSPSVSDDENDNIANNSSSEDLFIGPQLQALYILYDSNGSERVDNDS